MNCEKKSDGDDEDVEEESEGKSVPIWAQRENLERALCIQFAPGGLDPEAIFPEIQPCDLEGTTIYLLKNIFEGLCEYMFIVMHKSEIYCFNKTQYKINK